MIKHIFIPERIDSYYIFGKRVAAFDIGPAEIQVTVALLKGNKHVIEKLFSERIETDSALSHDERVAVALKLAAAKIGTVDEIDYVLPSSQVIFKELTLPFTGLKKIKMVVPFEVESMLPFSLDAAVLDCIITKEDTAHQQTDILVAAVKKEQINQAIALFESAGLPLHRISVDMFELYALYKMVNPQSQQSLALIDLGYYTTRLSVIINGQLKYIRSLPKGLITVAKKITSLNGVDIGENLQHLVSFGLNATQADMQYAQEALEELLAEINVSIESYTKKLRANEQLTKISLQGQPQIFLALLTYFAGRYHLETQVFRPKQLLHNAVLQSKVTTLPNSFIVSIGTALAPEITQSFNLQKNEVEKEENRVINYQLIALRRISRFIFFLSPFIASCAFAICAKRIKRQKLRLYRNCKKALSSSLRRLSIQAANKAAMNELKKQESAWHRLSVENRYAFLRILSELSRCINLKDTQLALTSLHIKEDSIKMYGSVPGYQQLIKLQNELECPLLKSCLNYRIGILSLIPSRSRINKEEA